MALVIGDVHGRLDKVEKFLKYKPQEKHIFTGDYVDSFRASDEDILNTLKVVIESNSTLLLGNHDIHYLSHTPFMCSGYKYYMAKGINDILESFIVQFEPVTFVDGFIITHGGISKGLANDLRMNTRVTDVTVETVESIIKTEWEKFLYQRMEHSMYSSEMDIKKCSPIFNIPACRGGRDPFGGIFWADYRDEEFYRIPQVFGHSKVLGDRIKNVVYDLWALGCDNERLECFNTSTRKVEAF